MRLCASTLINYGCGEWPFRPDGGLIAPRLPFAVPDSRNVITRPLSRPFLESRPLFRQSPLRAISLELEPATTRNIVKKYNANYTGVGRSPLSTGPMLMTGTKPIDGYSHIRDLH